MYDTVKGGDYLTDQDAAEVLATDAVRAIYELEHMGVHLIAPMMDESHRERLAATLGISAKPL